VLVTGRTSGSLVTEAQKQRLVSLERQPLDETFRTQSQALQGEESNLANLERNALTEAQLAMSADDQQQNNLQGIYSMLYQREADARAEAERQAESRRQAQAQAQYLASLNPSTPQETAPQVGLGEILGKVSATGAPGTNVLKPNYDPKLTASQKQNRATANKVASGATLGGLTSFLLPKAVSRVSDSANWWKGKFGF